MELYLMRHGIAEAPESDARKADARRRLTPEGSAKVRRIARMLKRMKIDFDLILSSPLLRSRITAEIVAEELALGKKLEITPLLVPDSPLEELVEDLGSRLAGRESVLLVGHEPCLSALASILISGSGRSAITLKKGGICKLDIDRIRYGRCATMEWLLAPAQMTRLR
jgi:phosphohistidine phosphatase